MITLVFVLLSIVLLAVGMRGTVIDIGNTWDRHWGFGFDVYRISHDVPELGFWGVLIQFGPFYVEVSW